jgi:hypothetical protein
MTQPRWQWQWQKMIAVRIQDALAIALVQYSKNISLIEETEAHVVVRLLLQK